MVREREQGWRIYIEPSTPCTQMSNLSGWLCRASVCWARCFVSGCDGVLARGITTLMAGVEEEGGGPSVISQNNGVCLRGTIILG